MNKYWRIGTGAMTYIKAFSKIMNNFHLPIGTKVYLWNDNNLWSFTNMHHDVLKEMYSRSTAQQYITVWEALGFIVKNSNNHYLIGTTFSSVENLIKLSKIYILIPSKDKKVERYRNTLRVNILFYIGVINIADITEKGISKTRGNINMETIRKSISEYEKEIVKDKEYIKKVKEHYDK